MSNGPWLGPRGPWEAATGYHRPRGIPNWLFWLTLRGRGCIRHGQGATVTGPDEAVLIRPRTPLDYAPLDPHKPWVLAWCAFQPRPHSRSLLQWPEVERGTMRITIQSPATRHAIETALTTARALMATAGRQRGALAMLEVERVLLLCDADNPLSAQARLDPRVQRALEYTSEHLSEPIALPELARAAGASVAQLCRLFKRDVGSSPLAYVERERLVRAGDLLVHSSLQVAEIAAAVGYERPFYFSTRFRHYHGCSPLEYRRSGGGAGRRV